MVSCMSCLYILDINPLVVISFVKCFSFYKTILTMKNFSISFLTLTTSQNRGGYFSPRYSQHLLLGKWQPEKRWKSLTSWHVRVKHQHKPLWFTSVPKQAGKETSIVLISLRQDPGPSGKWAYDDVNPCLLPSFCFPSHIHVLCPFDKAHKWSRLCASPLPARGGGDLS